MSKHRPSVMLPKASSTVASRTAAGATQRQPAQNGFAVANPMRREQMSAAVAEVVSLSEDAQAKGGSIARRTASDLPWHVPPKHRQLPLWLALAIEVVRGFLCFPLMMVCLCRPGSLTDPDPGMHRTLVLAEPNRERRAELAHNFLCGLVSCVGRPVPEAWALRVYQIVRGAATVPLPPKGNDSSDDDLGTKHGHEQGQKVAEAKVEKEEVQAVPSSSGDESDSEEADALRAAAVMHGAKSPLRELATLHRIGTTWSKRASTSLQAAPGKRNPPLAQRSASFFDSKGSVRDLSRQRVRGEGAAAGKATPPLKASASVGWFRGLGTSRSSSATAAKVGGPSIVLGSRDPQSQSLSSRFAPQLQGKAASTSSLQPLSSASGTSSTPGGVSMLHNPLRSQDAKAASRPATGTSAAAKPTTASAGAASAGLVGGVRSQRRRGRQHG
jgi:hypothetical protein